MGEDRTPSEPPPIDDSKSEHMTYNFDPEAWYDNELAFLQAQRAAGKLSEEDFLEKLAKLDRRYEQMVERLDGTYQIPRGKDRPRG